MTTTANATLAIAKRIDTELDLVIAERDATLRLPDGTRKNIWLAALFGVEAALWGELHESTSSVTLARAAIRARQYAQAEAARLGGHRPQRPARVA